MSTSTKTEIETGDVSRRAFVVTSLATGFALAVQPVAAETIKTDVEGLETAEVKVPVKDGTVPAYRAMPAKGGPFPVVLVVQEIFGVHEHIKDMCRRFAKLGYYAIAPELYSREGDVSKMSNIQDIISKVVSKVPDAQVMSDLDATVKFAKDSGMGNTNKLGMIGFCWGGRIVWLYAAHSDQLKAGVACYGRIVGKPDELHPKNPIDIAADLKAPVLGLYGEQDTGIPVKTLEEMREALKKTKVTTEIKIFPDAGHAFFADYRESYRKGPAEEGWKMALAWYKRFGVA